MGRGRQKAKHTKVARELKYHTASIDVVALQQELSGEAPERDDSSDDRYGDPFGYDDEDEGPSGRYASAGR